MLTQEIDVHCIKSCPVCDTIISDKMIKKDLHWLVEQAKTNQRVEYSIINENQDHYVWHKTDGLCFDCASQSNENNLIYT